MHPLGTTKPLIRRVPAAHHRKPRSRLAEDPQRDGDVGRRIGLDDACRALRGGLEPVVGVLVEGEEGCLMSFS